MEQLKRQTRADGVVSVGAALAGLLWLAPSAVSAAPDRTSPTVTVTNPIDGATVFGGIQIAVQASDDVGVVGVQFLLNGANLGVEDTLPPYAVAWNTATISNGSHTLAARARDAVGHLTTSASVLVTVLNTGEPSQIGQWSPTTTWPLAAVHATLLPTGEVLMWDAYELDVVPRTWLPTTGALTDAPNSAGLFCAGNALLADGRAMAVGGHPYGEEDHEHHGAAGTGFGVRDVFSFNGTTRLWTRQSSLRFKRWYPTLLPLSNGRLLALSGQINTTYWADTPELYDPATDTWTVLPQINTSDTHTSQYLFAHLLADGAIYIIGPDDGHLRLLNLATQQWQNVGSTSMRRGSVAMYAPDKLLMTGGRSGASSAPSAATAMVMDLTQPGAAWRDTTPMRYARYMHNLVVLPDGRVLTVGGSTTGETEAGGTDSVLPTELWDPMTEAWTTLGPINEPRMYHSTAVLLPDGRVLSAGGTRNGIPPMDPMNAQVYSPPYLFKGSRPVVTSAPSTVNYGQTVEIQTPDAARIASVVLISLGSNTHVHTMGEHYLPLPFSAGAGTLSASLPANPYLMPPGYYMMFLVDTEGVPSTAAIVQVPVPPIASNPPQAFQESAGQVVMEAEHYDVEIARNGDEWTTEVDTAGFSRTGYVQALPNTGQSLNTGYATTSPELAFNVNFSTTGTYYVWVRGQGDSGNDDSLHAGLDGLSPASADRMSGFNTTSWVWKRDTMDGVPATLIISTPGLHTIHLWMREDGLKVDKLLLRKSSSSSAPSGTGPAESLRVAPPPPPSASAFQESAGQVIMEAEHYDGIVSRSSHDWTLETAKAGFSGTGYMSALPNSGSSINSGYTTSSPELSFNVNFTTTGTYYVWIRGQGDSGNDDSCHAGLDGTGAASADRIAGFVTSWTWKRDTMDGAPATLVISSAGLHTIHLWMREDGLRVDRLLLRKSSSSTAPSGQGPVESPWQ